MTALDQEGRSEPTAPTPETCPACQLPLGHWSRSPVTAGLRTAAAPPRLGTQHRDVSGATGPRSLVLILDLLGGTRDEHPPQSHQDRSRSARQGLGSKHTAHLRARRTRSLGVRLYLTAETHTPTGCRAQGAVRGGSTALGRSRRLRSDGQADGNGLRSALTASLG